MKNKNCILFSAYGDRFINESILCANYISKFKPKNVDLILHTDKKVKDPHSFDEVLVYKNTFTKKRFSFRIDALIKIITEHGYEKVLHLDSDACIMKDRAINEIFKLLDNFDIAVAHAPCRTQGKRNKEVPNSFPEFNCGVISFTNNVVEVFRRWQEIYINDFLLDNPEETLRSGSSIYHLDQTAFRHVVYFSDLRIATLPPEYNNREVDENNCLIWHNRKVFQLIKK